MEETPAMQVRLTGASVGSPATVFPPHPTSGNLDNLVVHQRRQTLAGVENVGSVVGACQCVGFPVPEE